MKPQSATRNLKAEQRLMKDLKELEREWHLITTVSARPLEENMFIWHVNLKPTDGPFSEFYSHVCTVILYISEIREFQSSFNMRKREENFFSILNRIGVAWSRKFPGKLYNDASSNWVFSSFNLVV